MLDSAASKKQIGTISVQITKNYPPNSCEKNSGYSQVRKKIGLLKSENNLTD